MKGCEPAMPCQADVHGQAHKGLTKREMFAAMAMQGLVAEDATKNIFQNDAIKLLKIDSYDWEQHWQLFIAKRAVQVADALIAELNK